MEKLWRPEGVNILKGQVRAEWVEWGHVAAENTREHQRMLGMKFYVTIIVKELIANNHLVERK